MLETLTTVQYFLKIHGVKYKLKKMKIQEH